MNLLYLHFLIHQYWGVSLEMVYQVALNDIDELEKYINKMDVNYPYYEILKQIAQKLINENKDISILDKYFDVITCCLLGVNVIIMFMFYCRIKFYL